MILSVMAAQVTDACLQHYLRELLHAQKVAYSNLYIKLCEKWSGPNRTSRTARATSGEGIWQKKWFMNVQL